MRLKHITAGIIGALIIYVSLAPALSETQGNADVTFVRAIETGKGVWTFHVTVAHPDTGWKDYANGWDVVLPDETVVKASARDKFTRELFHPHEYEQPFTRSQSGLKLPTTVKTVRVRAHDIVDGFGGKEVVIDLTKSKGDHYKVERFSK